MKQIFVSKLEANTDDVEQDIHGLAKLTVAVLKYELADRDLSKKGNKLELRTRLKEYLSRESYKPYITKAAQKITLYFIQCCSDGTEVDWENNMLTFGCTVYYKIP